MQGWTGSVLWVRKTKGSERTWRHRCRTSSHGSVTHPLSEGLVEKSVFSTKVTFKFLWSNLGNGYRKSDIKGITLQKSWWEAYGVWLSCGLLVAGAFRPRVRVSSAGCIDIWLDLGREGSLPRGILWGVIFFFLETSPLDLVLPPSTSFSLF